MGSMPPYCINFFEPHPLIEAGKNDAPHLKMKPTPLKNDPPYPLKNEAPFQNMIPKRNPEIANWHLISVFHL